ncbi:MAG TPA: hypothetical protein VF075_07655, partial [Pyrinomonadaceae bacterium]
LDVLINNAASIYDTWETVENADIDRIWNMESGEPGTNRNATREKTAIPISRDGSVTNEKRQAIGSP